jgi:hypothetical protein
LEDHGALLTWPSNRRAVQLHFPRIGLNEAEKYIEKGAFAATGWSNNAHELPFSDFKVEVIQSGDGLAVLWLEDHRDVSGLYERGHRRPAMAYIRPLGLLQSQLLIHFPLQTKVENLRRGYRLFQLQHFGVGTQKFFDFFIGGQTVGCECGAGKPVGL